VYQWQEKVFGPVELAKYSRAMDDEDVGTQGGRRRSLGLLPGTQTHQRAGALSSTEAEYYEKFRKMSKKKKSRYGRSKGGWRREKGEEGERVWVVDCL
jgi:hypothetical protein